MTKTMKPRFATEPPTDRVAAADRQGGENCETAVVIPSIPINLSGTTCGYVNDCSDFCGGYDAQGPDVVYAYTAVVDTAITVDSCHSELDTMIFIWDQWMNMVACNDDRWGPDDSDCGVYSSRIERIPVEQGVTYYIVVAGYAGCGEYELEVTEYEPCVLDCAGIPEGEPVLHDGYVDHFNGGCNGFGDFQSLAGDQNGNLIFCGRSGWFQASSGTYGFDQDWFVATIGPGGSLECTLDSEVWTYAFIRTPADCEDGVFVETIESGNCGSASVVYVGQPGEAIMIKVRPGFFDPPSYVVGHEFDYILEFNGLQPATVAVESRSWSAVKELFEEPRAVYGKRSKH